MHKFYSINSTIQAETESLNTDVMRFMAIIGFCMMIVFAMAQDIYKEKDKISVTKKITVKDIQLKQSKPVEKIKPVMKQIIPEPDIQRIKEPVEKIEIEKLKQKKTKETAPKNIGFSLEFESSQVLKQLMQNNTVKLYAVSNKQFWQIVLQRANINILKTKAIPDLYYEMHRNTVPENIINTFYNKYSSDGVIKWGVVLPEIMMEKIHYLLKTALGGQLIIMPDGTIELK